MWSGAGVTCRTWSDPVRDQGSWVRLGLAGSCQGTSGSHMVPYGSVYPSYTNTGQLSDLSRPVGPYRVPTGFRRNPVLARRDPMGLDGSLDCPVSLHD